MGQLDILDRVRCSAIYRVGSFRLPLAHHHASPFKIPRRHDPIAFGPCRLSEILCLHGGGMWRGILQLAQH